MTGAVDRPPSAYHDATPAPTKPPLRLWARALALAAGGAIALAAALPLWRVELSAPGLVAPIVLTAYVGRLGDGDAATGEVAKVAELHRRLGLRPPEPGQQVWNWALMAGLAASAALALGAAVRGRRRWLVGALNVLLTAGALALAMAYGQVRALAVTGAAPAIVGVGHAGDVVAQAGVREGSMMLAAAVVLALLALRR